MNNRNDGRRGFAPLVLALALILIGAAPVLAGASFDHGLRLFDNGRDAEAREAFRDAVRADPGSAETYYFLGLAASRMKDHAGAIDAFEKAVRLDPGLAGAHRNLGIANYTLGNHAEAAGALDHALSLTPNDGTTLLFRGLAFQAAGRFRLSIPYYRKAMAADPDYRQLALYNIGAAELRLGDEPAARRSLAQAIEAGPGSDTAGDAKALLDGITGTGAASKRPAVNEGAHLRYDGTLTADEIDTASGVSRSAAVLELSGAYGLLDAPDLELGSGTVFSRSLYKDQTAFDLRSPTFSLSVEREIMETDAGLNYLSSYGTQGSDTFLLSHGLSPALSFAATPSWYVSARYNYQNKNVINSPDRDGKQNAAGIDSFYFFMDGKAYVSLGYKIEKEDADRSELDYLGHYVNARLNMPLAFMSLKPTLRLGYEYFNKDFSNVTSSIGAEREDDRHTARVGLTAAATDSVDITLDYEYIEANSNLSSSDFTENIFTFSAGVDF